MNYYIVTIIVFSLVFDLCNAYRGNPGTVYQHTEFKRKTQPGAGKVYIPNTLNDLFVTPFPFHCADSTGLASCPLRMTSSLATLACWTPL